MKTLNTVLPFFTNKLHLTKDVEGYQQVKGVLVPAFEILPFQIRTQSIDIVSITSFRALEITLKGDLTGSEIDLISNIGNIDVQLLDGVVYIINNEITLDDEIPYLHYVLEVEYDGKLFVSEIVTVFMPAMAEFLCSEAYASDYILDAGADVESGITVARVDLSESAAGFAFVTFTYYFGVEIVSEKIKVTANIGDAPQLVSSSVAMPDGVVPGTYSVVVSGACDAVVEFEVIEAVIFEMDVQTIPYSPNIQLANTLGNSVIIAEGTKYESNNFFSLTFTNTGLIPFFNYQNLESVYRLVSVNNRLKSIDKIELYTNLQDLELQNTEMTEIPENIDQCTQLYRFRMQDAITSIDRLMNNALLEELNLTNTQVSEIPATISNLTILKKLIIESSALTTVSSNIANLSQLTYISLSWNSLATFPDAIFDLVNIETLVMEGNIYTAISDRFDELPNLREFRLHAFRGASLPASLRLSNITHFSLEKTEHMPFPEIVTSMISLEYLNISASDFTELSPNIGNLVNINSLNLYACEFLKTYPESLKLLINLTTLRINIATDAIYGDISTMPISSAYLILHKNVASYSTNLAFVNLESATLQNNYRLTSSDTFDIDAVVAGMSILPVLKSLTLSSSFIDHVPSAIDQITLLESLTIRYVDAVFPTTIANLMHLDFILIENSGTAWASLIEIIPVELYTAASLIELKTGGTCDFTTLAAGVNALTALEVIYLRGSKMQYITTDLALCYNLKTVDLYGNKVLQVEVENLLTAFDAQKANYVNAVYLNIANQTPAIHYSQIMLDQITDLVDNYNFVVIYTPNVS